MTLEHVNVKKTSGIYEEREKNMATEHAAAGVELLQNEALDKCQA